MSFSEISSSPPHSVIEGSINIHRLTLALEPESAAMYCREMTTDMLAAYSDGHDQSCISSDNYMVVDAGGGTIDIAVHQAIPTGHIESVTAPVGNDCGGMKINESFFQIMEDIVDDRGFEEFLDVDPNAVNYMVFHTFEEAKQRFGSSYKLIAESRSIYIRLEETFISHYTKERIAAGVSSLEDKRITFDGKILTIQPSYMDEVFFKPVVDGLLNCIIDTTQNCRSRCPIDLIYLVGGFGGCRYVYLKLKESLEKEFPESAFSIVVPENHNQVVILGAVKYYRNPSFISSRVPDAHYGVIVNIPFKTGVHDIHYQYPDEDGMKRCGHVFCVYVQKDVPVKCSEYLTSIVVPSSKHDRKAVVTFCSSKNDVHYTVDKSGRSIVDTIGTLTVSIPPTDLPRKERKIEIRMYMGNTEIHATGKYLPTGEEVNVVLDFLS